MFIASDLHFWRGHSQGRRSWEEDEAVFSLAQYQELSPPCMEKLTEKRMDLMDSHKDMAINEQS